MAHWHDFNPWADCLVYLPDLDELSALLDPKEPTRQKERWLFTSKLYGTPGKLDAYILPQPSGMHDCGVRWGAAGEQYFSPYIEPSIAAKLIDKYRNPGA